MSTLSVVTPSYNQASFIEFCLLSVSEQNASLSNQHIVIDGGSTDGSPEIIQKYADRLHYWHSKPDQGQSAAISEGFQHATGDVLCWINSDDALAPGASAVMLDALGDIADPAWAIGQCLIIDSSDSKIDCWSPRPRYGLEDLVSWSKNYIMQPAIFWNRAMHDNYFSLMHDLHYGMDFDLWLRFAQIADPVIVAHPVGIHRVHSATKTSLVGRQMRDEYLKSLAMRLPSNSALLRQGRRDVALSAARSANASMFHLDRRRCIEFLQLSLSADPLVCLRSNFLKASLKLINPFQVAKSSARRFPE
jgi:glycosyltransferase involved in cell wall biosynthesis